MSLTQLLSLPEKEDTRLSTEEEVLLDRFFPEKEVSISNSWIKVAKTSVATAILFLVISNPLLDEMLASIKVLQNPYTRFLVKLVLFVILFTCLEIYMK